MKTKFLLVLILTAFAWTTKAQSGKIGYTNLELIIGLMPEYEQVEKELQQYQQKLVEQLQIKQQYAQSKLEEYQQLRQEGKLTPEMEKQMQEELIKLDNEIQTFAQTSQEKILQKRQEKLTPIVEKVKKAIDEVAEAEGYEYILNSTNSSGVSNILHAPEKHNITEKVLKKLGIELPKEEGSK